MEKRKKEYEENTGFPFSNLDESTKNGIEMSLYWPPWKFNDIVGYLDIGIDEGEHYLVGEIYLKRKHLPRKHPNRRIGSLKSNDILYFCQINESPISQGNNDSYIKAINGIIKKAEKTLQKFRRNYKIWIPPFELSCINFVGAHHQAVINRTSGSLE